MQKPIFGIDGWKLARHGLPENIRLMESLTAQGNGYMGTRGNFEEGYSGDSHKGSYVAGVWFPDKTRVGWWKNGYPEYFGKVINAVDFLRMDIAVNGRRADLAKLAHTGFYVELDMKSGLLSRDYVMDFGGAKVKFTFRRFYSIVERRRAHFQLRVEVLEGTAALHLTSMLDGDVYNEDSNYGEGFWDIVANGATNCGFLQMRTKPNPFGAPQFTVGAAMANRLAGSGGVMYAPAVGRTTVKQCCKARLGTGESLVLEKTVAVVTSRDIDAALHKETSAALLADAMAHDFDGHLRQQTKAWAERWAKADVQIKACPEAQQGIRFNIFQLFSAWYGEDERLNIGPKGFTGEKYGGAAYWDTEAYLLPMYLATAERDISEKLLRYRHAQLEGACRNARRQGLPGALYPMVTFTGLECHNEWEITFEEIHRNGAIAYAIYNYTNYTGDTRYLLNEGIEVLVEIARFWAGRVHFCQRNRQYMLHGVTGPNEYENNVNNNWYTNTIAKWVLEYTLETLGMISDEKKHLLGVDGAECARWRDIALNMYRPYDEARGVFVQHDTFLDKDLRPADSLPVKERPLNQHWSWDKILRSCFIKQADVLQGIYFFGDNYTHEEKKRNFEFYEPMTVHESSLSASIHAVLAAELGMEEKAVELYARTARLDLDNYNSDTEDGLHVTSMSGSWLAIVQGFAGMRSFGGRLAFAPFCPAAWEGYSFEVNYRGRRIHLCVTRHEVTLTLCQGPGLAMELYGKPVALGEGQTHKQTADNGCPTEESA